VLLAAQNEVPLWVSSIPTLHQVTDFEFSKGIILFEKCVQIHDSLC